MTIHKQEPTLTVTLNKQELEYIMGITQNFCGTVGCDEEEEDAEIRKQLFIATSRALGYNMQADGSIPRGSSIFDVVI